MTKPPTGEIGIVQDIPVPTAEQSTIQDQIPVESLNVFDRLRSGWVAVAAGTAALALMISPIPKERPAYAADPAKITIGMPFPGKWGYPVLTTAGCGPASSQTSHPSCHEIYSGSDWTLDAYGPAGTEVKLKASGDALTFSWDTSATGSCGETRRINMLSNNVKVGDLHVAHLSDAAPTNSAPTNGMTIGKIANLSCNPGGAAGKHVHMEFDNDNGADTHSCYVNHSTQSHTAGQELPEGTPLGILGSTNTGTKQECAEVPAGGSTPYSTIPEGAEFHDGGYIYTKVGGSAWPVMSKSSWDSLSAVDKAVWGGGELLGPVPTAEVQDHEAGHGSPNAHPPRDGTAVYLVGDTQQLYFTHGRAYPITSGELSDLGVLNQALPIPHHDNRLSGFTDQQLVLGNGEVYRFAGTPTVNQLIYAGGTALRYHVNNDTVRDCLRLSQGHGVIVLPQSAQSWMSVGESGQAAGCTFPSGTVLRGPGGQEQWRIEGNNPYVRRYYPSALLTYLHTSGNPDVQELSSAQSINNLPQGADMSVPEDMAFVDMGNGAEFVWQNGEWHYVPSPEMNTCLGLEPWEIVQVPSVAVGALPQGAQATCEYSNRVVAFGGVNYYIDTVGQSHAILNEAVKNCIVVRRGTGAAGNVNFNPTTQYPAGDAAYCPYETDPGLNFVQEGSDPMVWVLKVGEDGKLRMHHASGFCLPDPLTTQHKKYHLFRVTPGELAGIPQSSPWSPTPEACAALPGDGLIVNQYN